MDPLPVDHPEIDKIVVQEVWDTTRDAIEERFAWHDCERPAGLDSLAGGVGGVSGCYGLHGVEATIPGQIGSLRTACKGVVWSSGPEQSRMKEKSFLFRCFLFHTGIVQVASWGNLAKWIEEPIIW